MVDATSKGEKKMEPIGFEEVNKVLQKPPTMTDEQCQPLPVFSNDIECVSKWELSDTDIENIKKYKCIWLRILSGKTQPPVALSTEKTIFE